jgi:hypothetical protein
MRAVEGKVGCHTKRNIFEASALAHILAVVLGFAYMRVELGLQTCGGGGDTANLGYGRLEFLITAGAGRDAWRCADMLDDFYSPFRHDSVSCG